ncbi:unnamed protein product [Rotaria sordida]|uniref:Uncharacterized protein n=3 Tax=Rotaria sordida TaxID=392033 RepID=A0A814TP97_9BILA|nr:unnamed protein product [Rotaria sordida]
MIEPEENGTHVNQNYLQENACVLVTIEDDEHDNQYGALSSTSSSRSSSTSSSPTRSSSTSLASSKSLKEKGESEQYPT